MYSIIKNELLKIKREKINYLIIFISLFIPLLNLLLTLNMRSRAKDSPIFNIDYYMGNNVTYLSIIFGPMLIAFIGIYLFLKEYKDGTLKTLLLTPLTKNKIFWGKLVFTLLFGVCVVMISYLFSIPLSLVGGFPGINREVLFTYFISHLKTGFLLLSFIPFTFFITLLFRNILFALFVSLMCMISGMLIVGSKYTPYYPWSATILLCTPQGENDIFIPVLSLTLNFILFAILSYIKFTKEEV
ncbi:MAG: ABC transporter permease [Ignavibacteria bacterium]|nr:ABC transporter permease [Ignavibacteria bacterium]